MSLHVSLPTGERRCVKANFDLPASHLLSTLQKHDLATSNCQLRTNYTRLDLNRPLRAQGVVPGGSVEVEIEGNVELACVDVAKRCKSQEDWRVFFTDITQRLIPDNSSFTPEYIRLVLSGQKETLRLLDVRDYRFPAWMYGEKELEVEKLGKYCLESQALKDFVLRDCMDQSFLIKLIASLDYGYLLRVREEIEARKKGNKQEIKPQKSPIKAKKQVKRVISPPKSAPSKHMRPSPSPYSSDSSILEIFIDSAPSKPAGNPYIPIVTRETAPREADMLVVEPKLVGKSASSAIDLD